MFIFNHYPDFYEWFYLVFLVLAMFIRLPFAIAHRRAKRNKNIKLTYHYLKENLLAFLVGIGTIVLPVFDILSNYLDRFALTVPDWVRMISVGGMLIALYFYTWSHINLGRHWSPVLETKKDHKLVTTGIYRYIRHPMYTGFFLWALFVGFLIPNWVTIIAALGSFAGLYFIRIPEEEAMLVEQFGDQYKAYQQRTGKILPKFF